MEQVDARGMQCPKPLIMTRSALADNSVDCTFTVLIDNETSKENVERYLSDNLIEFETVEINGCWSIVVNKKDDGSNLPEAEPYCPITRSSKQETGHVICITSKYMGSGSDELGEILMKGFSNTIKEVNPLPSEIIFYNEGVKLVEESSALADTFAELENLGVKITVCGTCADYFGIKDKIHVGTISNMYDILDSLSKSTNTVRP